MCFCFHGFMSNPTELNNQAALREAEAGWISGSKKNQDTGKDFSRIFLINCPAVNAVDGRNPTPVDELFFSISYRSYTSHVVVWDFWTIHSRVSFELPFAIDPGFWLFVVWGYTSPGLYRDYNKLIKGSLWTNQSGASSWFCTLFSWKNASKDEAYTSSTFMKDTFLTPACFMGI